MLRRAGLVALAAVVLAVAVAALASATGRESDDRKVEVVKLESKILKGADLNLGDEAFGLGDRVALQQGLWQDGKSVGELGVDCVVIDLDGQTGVTMQCLATASLPDGQIAGQGLIGFTADEVQRFSLAVTGGTGDYRTARGEIRVEERSDEGAGTITVTLLR